MARDLAWELWGCMTYDDTLGQMGNAFLSTDSWEGSLGWFYARK